MKKLFTLILLMTLNVFLALGQYDVKGQLLSDANPPAKESSNIDDPIVPAQERDACVWEEARLLSETNAPNSVDAYPWISSDGLRIYYTVADNGNDIVQISRPHIDSTFRDPQSLSINTTDREISCCLDEDELKIWFVRSVSNTSQLMYSERPHRDSAFALLDSVVNIGNIEGFFAGPSMTSDESQLLMWVSGVGIRYFEATAPNQYEPKGFLDTPAGVVVAAGQLSKDGYKFFFSDSDPVSSKIVSMNRFYLSDTFDIATYEELPEEINDGSRQFQPSVTADGNTIIFVKASYNDFSATDLAIASGMGCATAIGEVLEKQTFELNAFPNPTRDELTIGWENLEVVEVQMITLQGQLLQRKVLEDQAGNQVTLRMGDYPQGMYLCQVLARNGASETVKFVVE